MRIGLSLLLVCSFSLSACERLSGAAEQKILDAEAKGYACRVSQKAPEDCMKDNETQSPTSILEGWKMADKDIKDKVIDPNMGRNMPAPEPASAVAEVVPAAPPAALAAAKPAPAHKPEKAEPAKKAH